MRSGVNSAHEGSGARTTQMGPCRGIDRGQDSLVRRDHGLCSGAEPHGLAQPLGGARFPCPRCGLRGTRLRVLEDGRGLPQTLAALCIVHGVDLHRPVVLPRYRARQSVSLVLPAFPDLLRDPLPAGGGLVDPGIPFDQPAEPGLVAGLQHADRLGLAADAGDHGLGDLGKLIAGGPAQGSRGPVAES